MRDTDKKVLLIYNARSGKGAAREKLAESVEILSDEGFTVTVCPITEKTGAEDILSKRLPDFDTVVCCGGDGTLNHVVNGIMAGEYRPMLGYLPTGSTNDFAATMGISRDAAEMRKAIDRKKPFFYDIGKFRDRYFNYIAAFGAFTRVSYDTPQRRKNSLGHAAYIIEAVRHLPIGESHRLTVKTKEETFSGNYIYGSVSSSKNVAGIDVSELSKVSMDDGLFEVTLVSRPRNIADINSIIVSVLTRNIDNNPLIRHFKTGKIDFEFTKPVAWTLDGEYGGRWTKAGITVIPRALGLLV